MEGEGRQIVESSPCPLGKRSQVHTTVLEAQAQNLLSKSVVLSPPPSWKRGGGHLIPSILPNTTFPSPDTGPLLLSLPSVAICQGCIIPQYKELQLEGMTSRMNSNLYDQLASTLQ